MGSEARTKFKNTTLIDSVLQSPVDRYEIRLRWKLVLLLVLLVLIGWAVGLVWRFVQDKPVDYQPIEEHFKYGSIGSEPGGSIFNPVGGLLPPLAIFKVMPEICPDLLPGGYASLGFLFEPGRSLPIGVSRRQRLGFEQVGLNCSVCHTGTVRETRDGQPQIVLGMPAHSLDLQKFFRFVVDCSVDERFNADNIIEKIDRSGQGLSLLDQMIYRLQLVPLLRNRTEVLRKRIDILLSDAVPAWGAGRVDTFNPYKAIQFNWNLSALPHEELIGSADFPSLWNQRPRDGMDLHWDGNNNSVDERNLSASLGAGVTPVTIDHERLGRVRDWIWTLPPPKYPFPVDPVLAAKGDKLYERHCAECHAFDGSRTGRVQPIAEIATDPHRLNSYTLEFAANQYTLYPDSRYRFTHFKKTGGYANQPLDGIWARAPYLHNGSVPTIRDLLEPPQHRPRSFYRGDDLYDQRKLGFAYDTPEAGGRRLFLFDTAVPGNGNGGHEYGTQLSDEDKAALVEYLKTL
jgi:mono/diheme cytochrome c family protein